MKTIEKTPTLQKTALVVKRMSGWHGNAIMYWLSEPLMNYDEDRSSRHVIVSDVNLDERMSGLGVQHTYSAMGLEPLETLIFACDPTGEVIDFVDMPGSIRGFRDHSIALRRTGFVIV